MKAVIQRVKYASVKIDVEIVGACNQGFMILLGVQQGDTEEDADKLLKKVPVLRIFEDENGKMNKSLLDVNGEALVVSQFTLLADCSHGRRPSFINSAPPDIANALYEYFVQGMKDAGVSRVETGEFGADMAVELLNDGPVTILLDSKELH
ncbi:D-aminoacyl-tRNA deacylase [Eubacterium coprostanoligenes]|uniref:D-aminoacyl-tRNA deacylase n=1 Tax=Eubacterium coprostanoligenes TaxID=290054 RepID=A0A1T4KKN2_9FIRM|nr:D-aminoacyl-tRNA deacylase [Eubacterium coprostanoligenes]SJZ42956.1 D-tyrosyl-tRNA(Tyr) deacylase [Eubacterium coprostanoligenes]